MSNLQQQVLIITGMHRSGTSLLASLLQSAGVDIGKKLFGVGPGNEKGHFEDISFLQFHQEVLRSQGISVEGWTLTEKIEVQPQFQEQALKLVSDRQNETQQIWGWKDPRTTLFADFWEELIPNAKFLWVYRSPWEVIDSLYRRADEFPKNPTFALDVWQNYNQTLLNFYDRHPDRCILKSIYSIVENPDALIEEISQKWGIYLGNVSSLYEKSLFKRGISESYRPKLIQEYFPEALRLYQQLNERTGLVDEYNGSLFSQQQQYFLPLKTWILQDWQDLCGFQRKQKQSETQVKQLQGELEQNQAQLQYIQSQFDPVHAQLQQTQGQLQDAHAQIHQQAQQLEQAHTQLHQQAQQLEQAHTQLHQQGQQLEQAHAQLHQQGQQLEQAHTQLHQQGQQLEQAHTQLHQQAQQLEQAHAQLHQQAQQLEQTHTQLEQTHAQLLQHKEQIEQLSSQIHERGEHLQHTQSQLHQQGENLQHTYAQLQQTQEQLAQEGRKLQQTQLQLNQTQSLQKRFAELILAMKSSKFWQLRTLWLRVKQLFGFGKNELSENQELMNYIKDNFQNPQLNLDTIPQPSQEERSHPQNIDWCVDYSFWIPEHGLYLDGWICDPYSQIKNLRLIYNQTNSVGLNGQLKPKNRVDVTNYLRCHGWPELQEENIGFLGCIPLKNSLDTSLPLYLEAELENNQTLQYKFPLMELPKDHNLLPMVKKIMQGLSGPRHQLRTLLDNHVGPTIRFMWQQRQSNKTQKIVREYGTQAMNPEVSIIVPLYGRIDFLQYQLALFSGDKDFQYNELIYILDDPRLYDQFLGLCDSLAPLFGVPFKTVYAGENKGYAGANNLGVSVARGDLLILLNSDVMPMEKGWVKSLSRIYKSMPQIGALGPKLLYEDGSIQHAGMEFFPRSDWDNLLINNHPKKGQPNLKEIYAYPQEMVAVTGACLMVSRQLYNQVGGLDEDYIAGNFEDSDFCLKLHQIGYKNYYTPEIELFHLENQSFQADQDKKQWYTYYSLYNCWLHNLKWENYIYSNQLISKN